MGPSALLLGIKYTELRSHLYAGMQPCLYCVNIREPGVDGGSLAAGSLSIIGFSVLRYTTGIAASMQQKNYPNGRNHGKSSTIVWVSFLLQRKTGRAMAPVDRQHNNLQGFATVGIRLRHTETNISGWAVDTVKEVGSARTFCFTGVYSRHG